MESLCTTCKFWEETTSHACTTYVYVQTYLHAHYIWAQLGLEPASLTCIETTKSECRQEVQSTVVFWCISIYLSIYLPTSLKPQQLEGVYQPWERGIQNVCFFDTQSWICHFSGGWAVHKLQSCNWPTNWKLFQAIIHQLLINVSATFSPCLSLFRNYLSTVFHLSTRSQCLSVFLSIWTLFNVWSTFSNFYQQVGQPVLNHSVVGSSW